MPSCRHTRWPSATTSPAGAILASIDAARALLQRDGEALLGAAITATRAARDELATIDGLVVLDGPGVDPLKLTLVLPKTGADGNSIEQDLLAVGLPVESADRDVLVAVVTLADTDRTVGALVSALTASIERHRGAPRPVVGPAPYRIDPVAVVPPRAAFFARAEAVPIAAAAGRVSAELIAPYPPGIPVIAPGEQLTPDVLGSLGRAQAAVDRRLRLWRDRPRRGVPRDQGPSRRGVVGDLRFARWAYRIEPTEAGCLVTETWDEGRPPEVIEFTVTISGVAERGEHNRRGMEETLARLAAALET